MQLRLAPDEVDPRPLPGATAFNQVVFGSLARLFTACWRGCWFVVEYGQCIPAHRLTRVTIIWTIRRAIREQDGGLNDGTGETGNPDQRPATARFWNHA